MLRGRFGLMIACRLRIAVLRLAALMAVIGMVLHIVWRTPHATRTMRSVVEIDGIALWLG